MTGKDFLNVFARDVLDPIAKKWNEWLDWVASAMTYTTDCLGPHDDGTVPDKSEMDPVLEGMNEIIRVGELIPSADYLAEGARELIDAIRDFSEGYVAEDLDRMNAGWVVLRDVVGRTHPEVLERSPKDVSDFRWLTGSGSSEEVWNDSMKDLTEGMYELVELSKTGSLNGEAMEPILVKLMSAMYGFEELAENDYEPAITGPLGRNTREVIEGYANSQGERVEAGMTAILDQLAAMYDAPE